MRRDACWCTHGVDSHRGLFCRLCAAVWPKLMQPDHRFAPIVTMRPIRIGLVPHDGAEMEAYMASIR